MKTVKSVEYVDEMTCRVILDDYEQLELDAISVSARGLCENDVLEDFEVEELFHETECIRAKKLALKLLNAKMRTKKQMKKLLEEKGISDDVADEVSNELENYGYIDDRLYAKTYIEYRITGSKKSWRAIFFDLAHDGVDKELLSEIKSEAAPDEFDRAKNVAENVFNGRYDERMLKKVLGVLQRNGFYWEEIKYALADARKRIKGDEFDDN